MDHSFSKRFGFNNQEKEITIRNDAPQELREFLIQTTEYLGLGPRFTREMTCLVLRKIPNKENWTAYPNVYDEVVDLISKSEWFYVYDIIEIIYSRIDSKLKTTFEIQINDYFILNGIGWKLTNGLIEYRGNEDFENGYSKTVYILNERKLNTAKSEIKEAINDLSRKPNPDITGSIQHSIACLECVAREITKEPNLTLGALIKKHPDIVPPPMNEVVTKIWGYSSQYGRHLTEGNEPNFEEAEFFVALSCAISAYLSKKHISVHKKNTTEENTYPF